MSRRRRSWADRRRRHRDVLFHIPTASALLRNVNPASAGGAENQVLILARELSRRQFQVGIATLDQPGGLRRRVEGVTVIAQPASFTSAPVIRTLVFWLELGRVLLANPSAVIVQRCATIHAAPLAVISRALGRRFLLASSGVLEFDRTRWKRHHWWLFDLGVRLADQVVVQTAEQVQLCRERFGRQPILIKSFAEPTEAQKADPEAFLWIGGLTLHKQPLKYLELARAVPEARFRMVCVPAGPHDEGFDPAEIKRLTAAVPNLELVPPRPRDELAPLYESAVAVVSTSVSEGMPNVFLEGWSRGIPGLALTHDPDGVLERERLGAFAAGSLTRLALSAREMWEHRNDRQDLAARCLGYVAREHAPESITDRWIEAFELA